MALQRLKHERKLARWRDRCSQYAAWAIVAWVLPWLGQTALVQAAPNVVVWGSLGPPPADATNIVWVSGAGDNGLALRGDGTVACWGRTSPFFDPAGFTNVLALAAGAECSLALMDDGTIVPWGWDEGNDIYDVPPDLTNAVSLSMGAGVLGWAVRSDHTVVCWANTMPAPPGLTNAVAVAPGQGFCLALRFDGTVLAWGSGAYGGTNVPAGLTNVVSIAAGVFFGMALRADGTVAVWGDNTYGQTNVPPGLTNVVAIAAGAVHCLALRSDGTVAAWGGGGGGMADYGQSRVPPGLANVTSIAAGGYSSMAVVGTGMPLSQAEVTNLAVGSQGFSAQVPTDRGRTYALEYKNSLSDSQWTLLPLVAGTGSAVQLRDSTPRAGQRFFRVRRWVSAPGLR